jgi:hypothetical protein
LRKKDLKEDNQFDLLEKLVRKLAGKIVRKKWKTEKIIWISDLLKTTMSKTSPLYPTNNSYTPHVTSDNIQTNIEHDYRNSQTLSLALNSSTNPQMAPIAGYQTVPQYQMMPATMNLSNNSPGSMPIIHWYPPNNNQPNIQMVHNNTNNSASNSGNNNINLPGNLIAIFLVGLFIGSMLQTWTYLVMLLIGLFIWNAPITFLGGICPSDILQYLFRKYNNNP